MNAQFAKRCLSSGICLVCGLALSWSWLAPPPPRGGPTVRAHSPTRRATAASESQAAMMVLLGVSVLGIGVAELVRSRIEG